MNKEIWNNMITTEDGCRFETQEEADEYWERVQWLKRLMKDG